MTVVKEAPPKRVEMPKADPVNIAAKLANEKPKVDKSRPVSSTPVKGTPWCVVWTGDMKVI